MQALSLLVPSLVLSIAVIVSSSLAQADPYAAKTVAKASDDWKKTVQRMQLPPGVKADLWAGEPHVANIVAFHFDEKGRCYVAETFRLHQGRDRQSQPHVLARRRSGLPHGRRPGRDV